MYSKPCLSHSTQFSYRLLEKPQYCSEDYWTPLLKHYEYQSHIYQLKSPCTGVNRSSASVHSWAKFNMLNLYSYENKTCFRIIWLKTFAFYFFMFCLLEPFCEMNWSEHWALAKLNSICACSALMTLWDHRHIYRQRAGPQVVYEGLNRILIHMNVFIFSLHKHFSSFLNSLHREPYVIDASFR